MITNMQPYKEQTYALNQATGAECARAREPVVYSQNLTLRL